MDFLQKVMHSFYTISLETTLAINKNRRYMFSGFIYKMFISSYSYWLSRDRLRSRIVSAGVRIWA